MRLRGASCACVATHLAGAPPDTARHRQIFSCAPRGCRGLGGPHDAGHYNSRFWECRFFSDHGRWDSDYGAFFLSWYSSLLVAHADAVLSHVTALVRKKCAGMILASLEAVCSAFLLVSIAHEPGLLGLLAASLFHLSSRDVHGFSCTGCCNDQVRTCQD